MHTTLDNPNALLLELVHVALTSDGEPRGRIVALRRLAADRAAAGERRAAADAIEAAIRTLETVSEQPGDLGVREFIGPLAQDAEALQSHGLARRAYEVGSSLLDDHTPDPWRGIFQQAIATTWARDRHPGEALRYYRAAADAKRGVNDSRSRLITIASLIAAEADSGNSDNCALAIAEAVAVIEELASSGKKQGPELIEVALSAGGSAEYSGSAHLAARIYRLTLDLCDESDFQRVAEIERRLDSLNEAKPLPSPFSPGAER